VLLNLISNGFYAVTRRGLEGDGAFRPLLKIATQSLAKASRSGYVTTVLASPQRWRSPLSLVGGIDLKFKESDAGQLAVSERHDEVGASPLLCRRARMPKNRGAEIKSR